MWWWWLFRQVFSLWVVVASLASETLNCPTSVTKWNCSFSFTLLLYVCLRCVRWVEKLLLIYSKTGERETYRDSVCAHTCVSLHTYSSHRQQLNGAITKAPPHFFGPSICCRSALTWNTIKINLTRKSGMNIIKREIKQQQQQKKGWNLCQGWLSKVQNFLGLFCFSKSKELLE